MSDDTRSPWSADETRQLHHEAFVAEVLRARSQAARPAESKPWWERLLNATAVTALVGVAGTGVLGHWVAGAVQERTKEREIALASYREYLNAELDTVKATYRLVGSYLSASEDLIFLTGPAFDPSGYEPDQRPVLEQQKQDVRKGYNDVDAQWRKERDSLGFLMAYYHGGDAGVAAAWQAAQKAVDAFNDCAWQWHVTHQLVTDAVMKAACLSEKAAARDAVSTLTQRLGATRQSVGTSQPSRYASCP